MAQHWAWINPDVTPFRVTSRRITRVYLYGQIGAGEAAPKKKSPPEQASPLGKERQRREAADSLMLTLDRGGREPAHRAERYPPQPRHTPRKTGALNL